MNVFEGSFTDVLDAKIAIVAARFNEFIVRELIELIEECVQFDEIPLAHDTAAGDALLLGVAV